MCRKICDGQKIKTKTKVLKRYQDIEAYSWIIKVMNIDWFLSQTINLTVKSVTQYVSIYGLICPGDRNLINYIN